jgi:hypothetical protein
LKEEMKKAVKEEIEKRGGEITLESKDDLGMLCTVKKHMTC